MRNQFSRLLLTAIIVIGWSTAASANPAGEIKPVSARFKVNYDQLKLPANEKMGMLGGSLLYDVNKWFSVGPSAYGAVSGQRGGFITIGLASELKKSLTEHVELNGGVFVGAGGGRSGYLLSGGGLMLRSHLGVNFLSQQWGNVGGGISYTTFPDGAIHSTQPYLSYEYPFSALFERGWVDYAPLPGNHASPLSLNKQEFAVIYRSYAVPQGVLTDAGLPQHPRINLMGVEWLRYLDDNLFLKLETEGAMGGKSNGYMQILLGGGYRLALSDSTAIKISAAAGVAGGGSVASGGGILLDGSLALQQFLTDHWYVEGAAGYVKSPGGFKAASVAAKIGYSFASPDNAGKAVPYAALDGFAAHRFRLRATHQSYRQSNPLWRTHHANLNVDVLGFQGDYFVNDNFYLSGQSLAAYKGMAGAYMTGLVGAGVHLPLGASPLFVDVEVLVGAAGGGGMDVSGGLVWQTNASLGYQLSDAYSLHGSIGLIDAAKGNFRAQVLGLSLAYHFSAFAK